MPDTDEFINSIVEEHQLGDRPEVRYEDTRLSNKFTRVLRSDLDSMQRFNLLNEILTNRRESYATETNLLNHLVHRNSFEEEWRDRRLVNGSDNLADLAVF